jgi:hypothetical protein
MSLDATRAFFGPAVDGGPARPSSYPTFGINDRSRVSADALRLDILQRQQKFENSKNSADVTTGGCVYHNFLRAHVDPKTKNVMTAFGKVLADIETKTDKFQETYKIICNNTGGAREGALIGLKKMTISEPSGKMFEPTHPSFYKRNAENYLTASLLHIPILTDTYYKIGRALSTQTSSFPNEIADYMCQEVDGKLSVAFITEHNSYNLEQFLSSNKSASSFGSMLRDILFQLLHSMECLHALGYGIGVPEKIETEWKMETITGEEGFKGNPGIASYVKLVKYSSGIDKGKFFEYVIGNGQSVHIPRNGYTPVIRHDTGLYDTSDEATNGPTASFFTELVHYLIVHEHLPNSGPAADLLTIDFKNPIGWDSLPYFSNLVDTKITPRVPISKGNVFKGKDSKITAHGLLRGVLAAAVDLGREIEFNKIKSVVEENRFPSAGKARELGKKAMLPARPAQKYDLRHERNNSRTVREYLDANKTNNIKAMEKIKNQFKKNLRHSFKRAFFTKQNQLDGAQEPKNKGNEITPSKENSEKVNEFNALNGKWQNHILANTENSGHIVEILESIANLSNRGVVPQLIIRALSALQIGMIKKYLKTMSGKFEYKVNANDSFETTDIVEQKQLPLEINMKEKIEDEGDAENS